MAADLAKWWAQNYGEYTIAKDCLLTSQEQACTRITWLFVCSFNWLSPCWEWPNTQKNGCWLTHIDHIQSESLCQTRRDQERGRLVQPAFCIVDTDLLLLFQSIGKYPNTFKFYSEKVRESVCQGNCHGASCCRAKKRKKRKLGMICEDGTRSAFVYQWNIFIAVVIAVCYYLLLLSPFVFW